MSASISQHDYDSLYVPLHKRSPSPSSIQTSKRSSWSISDTDFQTAPVNRRTYSIRDLLHLSSSPLARLSEEQMRTVRQQLYLPLSSRRSKSAVKSQRVPSPPKIASVTINTVVAVRNTNRNTERPGRVRRDTGGSTELRNKKSKSWGYDIHANGVQGDWRHSIVPALGA